MSRTWTRWLVHRVDGDSLGGDMMLIRWHACAAKWILSIIAILLLVGSLARTAPVRGEDAMWTGEPTARSGQGRLPDPPEAPKTPREITKTRGGRIVAVPNPDVVLRVFGEGDCSTLAIEGAIERTKAATGVIEVEYRVDKTCAVVDVQVREVDQTTFRRTNGFGDRPVAITEARRAAPGSLGATAITYGNYVHSSQTVQDIINIDIAKLQYHTDRNWNGACTWWQPDRWAGAYTGVWWNHPTNVWISEVLGIRCGSDWTRTGASATFHSDFLWCNFTASWQQMQLANWNYSNSVGGYGVYFWRNVGCPGTHAATAFWANINRYG